MPPACLAARNGNIEDLRSLDVEAVVNERDKFGANALDWASGGGHLQCVEYLIPFMPLEEYSKQPVKRRDGKSCLHWSCRNSHIETTEYLLEHLFKSPDALVHLKTGDGTTPVQLAFFGRTYVYLSGCTTGLERTRLHQLKDYSIILIHGVVSQSILPAWPQRAGWTFSFLC